MKEKFTKYVSLLSALVMLIGMCVFSLPVSALGSDIGNIDNTVLPPEHDISVMSFNILDYDTSKVGYEAPATRADFCVETIRKYLPDLIGIQEAADAASANNNFAWDDFFKTELAKYGYAGRQITEEDPTGSNTSISPKTMTIGAGLMIFWKTDRFTYDAKATNAHGSAQYTSTFSIKTASNGTVTGNDASRYYHWVRLLDTKHGNQPVFMFNTHFTINSSDSKLSSTEKTKAGNIMRTKEAATMSAKMKSVSGNYPCFSTGDYNCKFSASKTGEPDNRMLCNMVEGTGFQDSAMQTDNCIMCEPTTIIDHVFYKENSNFPLESRAVYEDHEGFQPSDHRAVMSYFDYLAPVSFASGSYDAAAKTLTDTTTSKSYTFTATPASPYTVKIFNEAGSEVSGALTLSDLINHYTIRLYLNNVLFSEIGATVRCTAFSAPKITAEGASAYFGKDAYFAVMPSTKFSATITVADSRIYRDQNCTVAVSDTFKSIASGVTTYYVKTPVGVFPLYICRETKPAAEGTLYVDDDIASATGTVAFVSKNDVTLVTAGANGFSSLQSAMSAAKENGVIMVAGGEYAGASTGKSVTLLGNHADTAPFVRKDQSWTLSPRTDETVINGTLTFSKNDDISVTVKGMTFVGKVDYSSILVKHTGDVAAMTKKSETVDIENNKFLAYSTNTTNAGDIYMNNSTMKKGYIGGNFFKTTKVKTDVFYKRPLISRNSFGLTVEANYFIDYQTLFYVNSEVSSGRAEAGNSIFTMCYNRFDNCGQLSTYAMCAYDAGKYDCKLLYNDFVRCGFFSKSSPLPAVCLGFGESTVATDFNNVSMTVLGNRFTNCYKPLELNRNTNSSMHGDMRYAHITISQNLFLNSSALNISQTLRMNVRVNPTEYGVVTDWDCSHNYFASPALNSADPMKYVYAPVSSEGVTGIDLESAFTPYYTNATLRNISSGGYASVQSIKVEQKSFEFDGQPHTLVLSGVTDDAVVSYSTDPDEERAYQLTPITLTDVGSQTVYFHVEKPGYQVYSSSAVLKVTPEIVCDHNWGSGVVKTAATCTTPGVRLFTCSKCPKTKEEPIAIDPNAHNLSKTWSKNKAEHWQECTLCHAHINTAAHIWDGGKVTKPATTTATGIKTFTCTVCKQTKTETVPKVIDQKDAAKDFVDVSTKDWYYKAVNFAYNANLFGGMSATKFAPNANMTRGMFVTVLGRLYGVKDVRTLTRFEDVKKSDYFSGYVKWASDAGIVSGISPKKFAPNANVTREQICKMMVEYCKFAKITLKAKEAPITFGDAAKISSWAKDYVKKCQTAGLVGGSLQKSTGKMIFDPQGNATRAQVAQILYNFSINYLQ